MNKVLVDFTNIPCPLNYVRTKIKLESLEKDIELEVLLKDQEAVESVETSLKADGYKILNKTSNSLLIKTH